MDNVGMEATAALVWEWANALLQQRDGGRTSCWAVEARENSRNAAVYAATPAWFAATTTGGLGNESLPSPAQRP